MSEKKYNIDSSTEIHKELVDLESPLTHLNYSITHQVPKDYWAEQESTIFRKLEVDEKKAANNKKVKRLWPWITGIAASIAIAIMVLVPEDKTELDNEEDFLGNIEISELEKYILDESELLYGSGELEGAFMTIE